MPRRQTVVEAIWGILMHHWEQNKWQVKHHRRPARRDRKIIGEFDEVKRIVHLYPHPKYQPKAMTGLHELIHIAFNLSGDAWDEQQALWFERYLWARIRPEDRQRLADIFEEESSAESG